MCLKVDSSRLIAKEDITVYKFLTYEGHPKISKDLHGKECKAVIKDETVSGKISICDKELFICHNDSLFQGLRCGDLLEYNFSWVFDSHVSSIIVDGEEIVDEMLITPYQKTPIVVGNTYQSDLVLEGECKVEIGLHSFEFLEDVLDITRSFPKPIKVIAECVIPKGATYYKGIFNLRSSIASDTLIYKKIIDHVS